MRNVRNQHLDGRFSYCNWKSNSFICNGSIGRAGGWEQGFEGKSRHLKVLLSARALLNDLFLNIPGRNALHVDVDVSSGFIYWCDFSISEKSYNAIRRIKPNGSNFTNIITQGIGENGVRGIAVDWVAGK